MLPHHVPHAIGGPYDHDPENRAESAQSLLIGRKACCQTSACTLISSKIIGHGPISGWLPLPGQAMLCPVVFVCPDGSACGQQSSHASPVHITQTLCVWSIMVTPCGIHATTRSPPGHQTCTSATGCAANLIHECPGVRVPGSMSAGVGHAHLPTVRSSCCAGNKAGLPSSCSCEQATRGTGSRGSSHQSRRFMLAAQPHDGWPAQSAPMWLGLAGSVQTAWKCPSSLAPACPLRCRTSKP